MQIKRTSPGNLALLAIVIPFLLTSPGCKDKEPPPLETQTNNPALQGYPPPNQSAPSKPTVTLIFKHPKLVDDPTHWNSLLSQFQTEHPNIRVQDEPLTDSSAALHDSYAQDLQQDPAQFDVFAFQPTQLARFAAAGWLADLSSLLPPETRSDFFPATLQACSLDKTLYALPWLTDAGVLYYRRDLLEKHKVPPPPSWGDLLRVATQLQRQEQGIHGFLWPTTPGDDHAAALMEFVYGNSGQILARTKVVINSPENAIALDLAASTIQRYKITPSPTNQPAASPRQTFLQGKGLFLRDWASAYSQLQNASPPVGDHVGITTLPTYPGQPSTSLLGGWLLGVTQQSKHPQEAAALAKYLNSLPGQELLAEFYGLSPSRPALYSYYTITNEHPVLVRCLPAYRQASPPPVTPVYSALSQALQEGLQPLLTGQAKAAEILKPVSDHLQSLVSQPQTVAGQPQ